MSDLPDPLTPADCDLRGFEWMPLWGHRMFTSSWYRAARKDGRGGIASLKLWWVAMLQHPAGSLPNDEEELCMLADFGEDMRAWRKHRAVAMHGFILCCDNRWYHPMVAEQAVEAYERRLKATKTREADADRLRRWRANRNGGHPPPNDHETPDETRFKERFETPIETRVETDLETCVETDSRAEQEKNKETGKYKTEREPLTPRNVGDDAPPAGTPSRSRSLGNNLRAEGINPRKTGDNPRANGTNPRANGTNPRAVDKSKPRFTSGAIELIYDEGIAAKEARDKAEFDAFVAAKGLRYGSG